MNEDRAFAKKVRKNPDDDTARLIYADYLEEAGDARGELIRLQVGLANMPKADPSRHGMTRRVNEIFDAHGDRWVAPLREVGVTNEPKRCFHKGFIEQVTMDAEAFLDRGWQVCELAPTLRRVDLHNPQPVMGRLATMTFPPQITALGLSGVSLTAEDLAPLRGSPPWARHIRELNLERNLLGRSDLRTLAAIELPKLKTLLLSENQIGADPIGVLAGWPSLAGVRMLHLSMNEIGDDGAQRLAKSPCLSQLRELNLSANVVGDRGLGALANAASLDSLRRLILRAGAVTRSGYEGFARSPLFGRLELLDLRGNAAFQHALQDHGNSKIALNVPPRVRY